MKTYAGKYKNEIIILSCIYILAVIIGVFYYINLPMFVSYSISGDSKDIKSDWADARNSEYDGYEYRPVAGDPGIVFYTGSETISGVELIFDRPLPCHSMIQVFYAPHWDFDEENSFTDNAFRGSVSFIAPIPRDVYNYIRIDIDVGIGDIVLIDSILIYSDSIIESSQEKIETYDYIFYLIILCAVLTVIILLLSKHDKINLIFIYISDAIHKIRINKKRYIILLLTAVFAVAAAFVTELLISKYVFASYFIYQRFLFFSALLLSALFIYIFIGKPGKLFLCLSLIIGTMFSVTLPPSTGYDETIHRDYAILQASVYDAYYTNADRVNTVSGYFLKETREMSLKEKEISNETIICMYQKNQLKLYTYIGNTPSGVGTFLGRALGLPWIAVFILGRLFNLFAYTLVVFFAIKRLNYGKYVLAVIALLPSAMAIAANYSYDSWVIAWVMLGTSYFVAELQEPDKKISRKNIIIMLSAFVIGLGPKAVYFPLMFMLYFLKKNKFADAKQYRNYLVAVTCCGFFVVASIALPFIYRGPAAYSDIRGGADVHALSQMKWIIYNLPAYIKLLIDFSVDYFQLSKIASFTLFYAYLGQYTHYNILLIIFITAVVITDRGSRTLKLPALTRFVILACCFITIPIVITSMYVAFTPVASDVINGVQQRYFIPFFVPALLAIQSNNIINQINKKLYSGIIFGFCAFLLFASSWEMFIAGYH